MLYARSARNAIAVSALFELSLSRKAADPVAEITTPVVDLTAATTDVTVRHTQCATIYSPLNSFVLFSWSPLLSLDDP